jgi:carbamoyl-phosphate synthase small subunit
MFKPAILVLADGRIFQGSSIGASGDCVGELVFNTAMTGYQEIVTDPSYAKQIVMLTTAHVGNTGCNDRDLESSRIWASGLVIRNYSKAYSNYRAEESLSDWLKKNGLVAIADIDTRQLTLYLREHGAQAACISTNTEDIPSALAKAKSFTGLSGLDLAKEVSRKTKERWDTGRGTWSTESVPLQFHIVAYDFGVKSNILQILYDKGCHLTIVPAQTSVEEVMSLNPDGIFLSNGPGDPEACDYAIAATQGFLDAEIPLFGICLGFQILGLALGAQSKKMKFGHHGANHPVGETAEPKRVFITSQNHGFCIDELTLPDTLEVTHRSLFDNSLQGFKHKFKPALGFQGHPEASPGPHDMENMFEQFISMMRAQKNRGK